MPRLSKTQQRRLAKDILSKSKKLWSYSFLPSETPLSTKDYIAIEAIISRTLKRIG